MKTLYVKTHHMGRIWSDQHEGLKMIDDMISYVNHEEIFPDQEGELYEDYEVEEIESGQKQYLEAQYVSIENIEKYLEVAKKEGATHVAIDWHCDHVGYDIYMAKMTEASESDIEEHLSAIKQEADANKQKKIDALERKLAKLKTT